MSTNSLLPSPTLSPEQLALIAKATSPEEIRAQVVAAAEQQLEAANAATAAEQAEADRVAAAKEAEEKAKTPAKFTRVEIINGREIEFVKDTELELERAINDAYRVASAFQPTAENRQEQPDPAVAQAAAAKAAEDRAAELVELELLFKRGELNAAEYLEQSGAVDEYLAKKGISVDSLKSAVETDQDAKEQQKWREAVNVFLKSPGGQDWPGGEKNLKLINDKIYALGLIDRDDISKVDAFTIAWSAMKKDNTFFPYEPPTTAAPATVAATTQAAVPAVGTPTSIPGAPPPAPTTVAPRTSSSLFGASSGAPVDTAVAGRPGDPKFDVPANATPTEIMEIYKASMLAQGKDPNAEFTKTFASRQR